MVPRILQGGTAQVSIFFIRFLQNSLVSCSFLVLLRYYFLFFYFISTCLMVSPSNIPTYLCVSFSPSFLIFSWFGSSIPSVMSCFPFFIISTTQIPSICPAWLHILNVCIRVFISFSFMANSLMSSLYIRWLILSCDFLSLYPAVHFLSMWLSGIIRIINSIGDSVSPWNISLWNFASTKLFPPAVDSTPEVVYDIVWYFVHLEAVYYPALQDYIICLLIVNPRHI